MIRVGETTVPGMRIASTVIAVTSLSLGAFLTWAVAQTVPAPRPDPEKSIQQARALGQNGKWEEAVLAARRAVAVLRANGAPEQHLAIALNDYAQNLRSAGDPAGALAPAAEALEFAQRLRWPDNVLAVFAYNHGATALDAGSPNPARPSLELAAGLFEQLGDAGSSGRALSALGSTYLALGDHRAALDAFERAALSSEAERGMALTLRRAQALLALGDTEAAGDAIAEAEATAGSGGGSVDVALTQAAFDIAKSRFEAASERLGTILSNEALPAATKASAHYRLGEVDLMTGRYAEAEENTRRALSAYESVVGPGHQIFGSIFHRLAIIRQEYGDFDNAEQFYLRARAIFTEALGEEHPFTLDTRLERVRLLVLSDRIPLAIEEATEARALLATATDASAKAVRRRGISQAVLALAQSKTEQPDDAVAMATEAVLTFEGLGRAGLLDMTPSLNLLAEIELEAGRINDAKAFANRAFEIQQTTSAVSPDRAAESRRLLAEINLRTGDRPAALALARKNVEAVRQRLRDLSRRTSLSAEFRTGAARRQIGQLVRMLIVKRDESAPEERGVIDRELFDAVQLLSVNQSAKALNAAVAKTVVAPEVTELIDRRQKLSGRLLGLSRLSEQVVIRDDPDAVARLAEMQREIDGLEVELEQADLQLADAAPDFFSLVTPQTRELSDVQAALSPGEALWMNASFENGTIVFVVTKDRALVHWDSSLSSKDLDRIVTDLRSSIDELDEYGSPPKFQPERARELYRGLFLPVEAAFEGVERLFLIPDGAAQQIPLGVAMSPDREGVDSYLGLRLGLAVLPSVESLLVFPEARQSRPEQGGFMGFGNPLFGEDAPSARPEDLRRALAAPNGFIEDSRALRYVFVPLPETELELNYLASAIGGGQSRLFFRENATEARVKSEELRDVSVLAFATHAVASGEFDGANEPGLALSPPESGTAFDDGFLSASEVAQLKLSADLVILSACNTGSPALRSGAEGLSGLTRAFFHAGSKSLLVSHWAVNSQATVYITTQWAEAQRKDPDIGRIEAFRATIRAMADGDFDEEFSHPYYWAPFILVGLS